MLIPHNPERLLGLIRDSTIVVEGKRDKEALNGIGITNVIEMSSISIESFIEKLDKNKEYIILTDYDKEGEKKNKEICKFLQKFKIKLNLSFRRLFKSSFGITKIEELIKFSKIKEDDYNGKVSTIDNKILSRSRFYRKWCSRKTRCDWSNFWSN
jgi:5S rRNA maturation endonuclease (ribonuclease M5)